MGVFSGAAGPVVVGHRGAPRLHRENTLASFRAAARAGARWVELDARRTADGQVAVRHDPHVGGVPLVNLQGAALARCGIDLLGPLLDALPAGLGVDVELKNLPGEPDFDEHETLAAAVAEVVRPRVGSRPLLLSSFNPLTVAAVAAALPDVPVGLVSSAGFALDAACALAGELGVRVLCANLDCPGLAAAVPDATAPAVAAVHAAGVELMVWTVDDLVEGRRLAAAGVDALCTDDPAGMVRLLT